MRVLSILLLSLAAWPAQAEPVTRIDTDLVKGCRFIADDGEVGDYALKRCPGFRGAQVLVEVRVQRVALQFKWGKAKAVTAVDSGSIGTRLEWRGTGSRRNFKPHAVIVPIVQKDHDTDERHNVLGVLRMEPRNACLIAVIDEAANKDALTMARSIADTEAADATCKGAKPKVAGAGTRWAREAAGLAGDPPR